MLIKCFQCGNPVSSIIIPETTVIRATIQCPECIEKEMRIPTVKFFTENNFPKIFVISWLKSNQRLLNELEALEEDTVKLGRNINDFTVEQLKQIIKNKITELKELS